MNDNENQNHSNGAGEPEVVIPEVIDIKDVKHHRNSEDIPHGPIYGAPGNGMAVAALILAALSLFITVLGLLFSWLFYVGFMMNLFSFAAAGASLLLIIFARIRRSRSGMPKSLFHILVLIAAVIALFFSTTLFSCTGRAACIYCSSQHTITQIITR